jgi:hypothetical protein
MTRIRRNLITRKGNDKIIDEIKGLMTRKSGMSQQYSRRTPPVDDLEEKPHPMGCGR